MEKEDTKKELVDLKDEILPVRDEKPGARNEKPPARREIPVYLFLISVLVSVVFGGLSGWYFSGGKEKEIVVLDVAKIVEAKKKEFVEKYKERETSPNLKKEMETDIAEFTNNLNKIIQEQSKRRIVLLKDSVVSETWDITDEVEKRIKGTN